MSQAKTKPEDVDKKTAQGKGEGGFSPHPDHNDNFQGDDRSKEQARHVTPPGKGRSK